MKTTDDAVQVRHALAGRVRYHLPNGRRRGDWEAPLTRMLETIPGVWWTRTNPACDSVVVRFDPGTLDQTALTRTLTDFCRTVQRPRPRAAAARGKHPPNRPGLGSAKRRFACLSAVAAGVFVGKTVLGLPLAGTLFSPLGAVTVLMALPLIRAGLSDLRRRRVSLESFLGGSIVAAAAAGEVLAALEILWITSAGNLLQAWITERSRRSIRDILAIAEKETYLLVDGLEVAVTVEAVQPGDTVALHTGEKISVDGRVISGGALVDESPITGVSEPSAKTEGDAVFAGTFVRQGVVHVRAERVGDETYLARILIMVEASLQNRAPIEGVADTLARNLIKAGFVATLSTLAVTGNAWRAFAVLLVMACPCATILAASTAVSAAISTAARRHILIKGGRYLEAVRDADVICFDKTGTLTTNQPEIRQLVNLDGLPEEKLLQLAYSAEIHNQHPVALAIKEEARRRGLDAIRHDVCDYILGMGVRSVIDGEEVLVGSHKLMDHYGVQRAVVETFLEQNKRHGLTLVFIARNAQLLGVIGFANRERPGLPSLMDHLKRHGIRRTAMITGDARHTALEMARRLRFDECRYSILPEEKADIVAGLRQNGGKVLMVGDGINDALALAEADIGVAMGAGGSEAAIEAADIALVDDDLNGVVYVRALSRKTIDVVHQNFWIATGSNIAGVALGALGWLSPVMAGMVHISHTLGILVNSSRLLFYEPPSIVSKEATSHEPEPQDNN